MRLGISTYSFPWAFGAPGGHSPFTWKDLLEFADKNKIGYVQIADNYPLHALPEEELMELKNIAAGKNIGIQVGTRRLTMANLTTYIPIARLLNSPFVRVVIDDADHFPDVKEVTEVIRNLLPLLQESNVQLAIENHDRFPVKTLRGLIEDTDPNWVGICLDTTNSLGAGEGVREVVTHLAPYAINLHIKDFIIKRVDHKMGFQVSGCIAGSGSLDIPWLVKEMSNHERCTTATLEVWSDPEATLEATRKKECEWVKKSIDYLKTIMA